MDSLTHYRNTIQTLLKHYYNLSQHQPASNTAKQGITEHLILDAERDQYLWLRSGWDDQKRVQHIILYFRIEDSKVWVETDNTDLCVVDDLIAANIPQQDIVLGFHHPSKRPLTEFALGA
ncbi:MAG: XisI protein [Desertifilum sp.]|nr:XisI protein [Desertifilum sp.]